VTYVSRDPFARTELHKTTVKASNTYERTCRECGGVSGNRRLYAYRTESDGGRCFEHPGWFCSVSCFRTYHS
jgi:hypothetical protein